MPAVVGDIFGLGDVYIRQVSPVTVGIDTSGNFITESGWSNLRSYGWFGGGNSPAVSTVDRIDFSNDTGTASVRGSLSAVRYQLAATGNSNYGWFGGGQFFVSPSDVVKSTVNRIDFSNDSVPVSVRGSLSLARSQLAATGNSNYGWFGGGTSTSTVSTVDRIDFSNDSSTASPRGPLSAVISQLAATGNSNYGWFGGGYNPALAPAVLRTVSAVDRIDFSNDSATASVRGPLSLSRVQLASTGNSNYGWFGGGAILSRVDRIDFSNDLATASPRGNLSLARSISAATGNFNYGWFGGGNSSGFVSTVDRIDFSNDSATASVRGSLGLAKTNMGATSGQAKGPSIKLQKAGNFGWFGGGLVPALPAPLVSSRVDRIDFSNDTGTALVRGPLSLARFGLVATGNSNYGWFGGGSTPGARLTTVDRIDFSNDSATASIRGPLSVVRNSFAATGNSNYGWFGGGNGSIPGAAPFINFSSVNRIDFSNDSATASPRGSLSVARQTFAATGNSNYGWFGGGYNPALGAYPNNMLSTIDRIDFSNDFATSSVRGPLSSARYYFGATGNSNYGWFGGGFSTGPAPGNFTSQVNRMDFSNDSATASVRGTLTSARRNVHATGNSNYGWFSGDFSPSILSVVDRINFSNDMSTASLRSPLSVTRYSFTATSNTPIG